MSGQRQSPPSRRPRAGVRAARDYRKDGVWIVGFIAASVVGGLAAAAVIHENTTTALLGSVAVAGLVAVALQVGVFDERQADNKSGRHGGGGQVDQPDTQPEPESGGPDPAQGPPMQWPFPFGTTGQGAQGAGGAPVSPPVRVLQDPATAHATRGMSIADFVGKAVIAQCPDCADFGIDADPRSPRWRFACRACGSQWSWQPGTPWPEVHVRPEARYSDRY